MLRPLGTKTFQQRENKGKNVKSKKSRKSSVFLNLK